MTDKAKELTKQLKEIGAKIKVTEDKVIRFRRKYWDMEGMYGKKVDGCNNCADMHYRGYDFEYPTDEAKVKEKAEREKYYETHVTSANEELEKLNQQYCEVNNNLCIEKYGCDYETKRKRDKVKREEKRLAELKKEVEELEKWIEENK